MKVSFSKNLHDDEGDVYVEGIFLHIGEHVILKVSDETELDELIEYLQRIKLEICPRK